LGSRLFSSGLNDDMILGMEVFYAFPKNDMPALQSRERERSGLH